MPPEPASRRWKVYCRFVQKVECAAWGDANMRELRKGHVLQLERKGYYIVDVPAAPAQPGQPGQPAVLFTIPDGHQKKQSPPAAPAAPAATTKAEKSEKKLKSADKKASFK